MGLAWTGRDKPTRQSDPDLDMALVLLVAAGTFGFLMAGWALWQS